MKLYSKIIIILLPYLCLIFCQQKKIIIDDTTGYIAFHRNPEAGNIFDFDIWLINTKTGKEIQLTKDLRYWEYNPVWMSDSELLHLIEPQEKTMTETNIVYTNLYTGKEKILDFWSWENSLTMDKISVDLSRNIYYSSFIVRENQCAVYRLPLGEQHTTPEEILSPSDINKFGLVHATNPVISPDGTKLLIVACDTAKYRRFHSKEPIKHYYDIYIYDLKAHKEKSTAKRLTYDDSTYEDPVWLSDDQILFTSNRSSNYELYLMHINGNSPERLTFSEKTEDTRPAVSPDGKKIAYSKFYEESNRYEIWIMDLETRESWFLTEGSGPDWCPAQ